MNHNMSRECEAPAAVISAVISAAVMCQVRAALDSVRDGADAMPASQVTSHLQNVDRWAVL